MRQVVRQHDIKDCGAACLSMIARYYNLKKPLATFRELIAVDSAGASMYGITQGARKIGLLAEAYSGTSTEFLESVENGDFDLPVIAHVIVDGMLEHYVVIYKISRTHIYIADPARGRKRYRHNAFFAIWTGHIIAFQKTINFVEGNECGGTLRRFLPLIFKQRALMSAALIISVLIAFIGFTGAFIFQFVMMCVEESAHHGHGIEFFSEICVTVLCLYCFGAVLEALRGFLLARIMKKVDLPLLTNLYRHIADLPVSQLESRKTGEFMSRFSDAQEISEILSGTALSMVLDTVMTVGCACILFSVNSSLFFIALGTVALYAIITVLFARPIRNISEKQMEQNAVVTSYMKESLDGIETVKALGAESKIKERFADKMKQYIKTAARGMTLYTSQNAVCGLIASSGIILLLWVGTDAVVNEKLSLASLLTFYSLFGYFITPIQRLLQLQPQMQTALTAAARLNDILDLKTEPDEKEAADMNGFDIQVEHVGFRYGYREPVLHDINMTVNGGECIALVGESGSGKTTLAKLLMAFYLPQKGTIRIGGREISDFCAKKIREQVAYISQDIFLFSGSVRENLLLGNEQASEEDMKKACRLSRAQEFIDSLPMGYDTIIGENGLDLSGGQRQRLAIARALLKKPGILILDEATSNLDPVTEQSISESIEAMKGNITCIVIAHRLSTVRRCDRIYVLKKGRIEEHGSHEELLQLQGEYARFYKESSL